MSHPFNLLIVVLIKQAIKFSTLWLLFYALLFIGSLIAIYNFIGVDTDSSRMLRSSLDFQVKTQSLNSDFPDLKNTVIVVVRADIAELADEAVLHLEKHLSSNSDIDRFFSPSTNSFFVRNGLLYKDVNELEKSLDQLNKSASLLASIRDNQSLENFFHALYTAEDLAKGADFDLGFLDDFYETTSRTIEARLAGQFMPLSWASIGDKESALKDEGAVQRLVYIKPKFDYSNLQPVKKALLSIQGVIDTIPTNVTKATHIGVTGDPVLRFEELSAVKNGIGYSLALSFLLMAILLYLVFRSFSHVILTLMTLVVALVLSTGFAALVFEKLNLVSVAFVVLLVGLGLDFTIHVLAHLKDGRFELLSDKLVDLGKTLGNALLLSAATTAIAFLAFTPTNFTGIAQLGFLGAFGVIIAFILSITLVPALIIRFSWFQPKNLTDKDLALDRQGLGSLLTRFLFFMRWPFIACLLLLGVLSAYFVKDVRFDADPVSLRDPLSPSMQTLALLEERPQTVPYRLSLMRPNEEEAKKAVDDLSQIASVRQARILSDLIPDNQEEKLELIDFSLPTFDTIVSGEGLDHARLPSGKSAWQALIDRLSSLEGRPEAVRFAAIIGKLMRSDEEIVKLVEQDIFRYFPAMIKTLETQTEVDSVTLENLPTFFKDRFIDAAGHWRIDIVPENSIRNRHNLIKFVNDVEAYDSQVAGAPLQIVKAGDVVSSAMVIAVFIAGVSILVLSFFVLKRVFTVVAIFLPLLLGGIMTAGVSAYFGIAFNYANIIVLPLLIGLGVDSGIHVALRRRQMKDSYALFQSSTPRAVFFSGLTTIAAFATLSLSDHKGTASMGIMLAIAISLTLACSLLLTPVLIDLFDKWTYKNRK